MSLLLLCHDEPALVQLSSLSLSLLAALLSSAVKLRVHHKVTTWRPHQSCIHRPRGMFEYPCQFLLTLNLGRSQYVVVIACKMPHYLKCTHADTLFGRARAGDDTAASAASAARKIGQGAWR